MEVRHSIEHDKDRARIVFDTGFYTNSIPAFIPTATFIRTSVKVSWQSRWKLRKLGKKGENTRSVVLAS